MVTIDDVEAARRVIAGAVARTPSATSEVLSEILGCTIVLKFETLQFTASFKERGARNRLEALSVDERAAGVVAVSAGNHAQAVARHAALLGISATIVMPETTPFVKIARTRYLGGTVELRGADLDEAMAHGRRLCAEGRTFIHPFDDPLVIAGQGTVALEMLEDDPDLDAIVVPVGGGGLAAGVSVVAQQRGVEVVGVQSEAFPAMASALDGIDRPIGGPTMAEGIAVEYPGALTTGILRDAGVHVVVVSERAIEDAVNQLLDIEKVVVEGAGAAGIAAIAQHRERFAGRRVGVVLTGANIDPMLLAAVINRGLVHSGRLARVQIGLDDRPGTLAALLAVVAGAGANVFEVRHQRVFADVPIRGVEVELVIECQDAAHRDAVLAALEAAGYRTRLVAADG
jgi:threonine dehydratase